MRKINGNTAKSLLIGVLLISVLSGGIAYAEEDSAQNGNPGADTIELERNSGGTTLTDPDDGTIYYPLVGLEGLVETSLSQKLWETLLISFIFGALGGTIPEFINIIAHYGRDLGRAANRRRSSQSIPSANDENSEEYLWNWLVLLALCMVGGLAAPPATFFLKPQTMYGLISLSIVTGSAGTAIFKSLQERVVGSLNQARDIARREIAEETLNKQRRRTNAPALEKMLGEVKKQVTDLIETIEKETTNDVQAGKQILRFPGQEPGLMLQRSKIDEIFKSLNNIKVFDQELAEPILEAFGNLRDQIFTKGETLANNSNFLFKNSQTLEAFYLEEVKRTLDEAQGKINIAKQGIS